MSMNAVEQIETTKGLLPLSLLRKEERTEGIPCGSCTTTKYFLGEELVRQDQLVKVKEGLTAAGATGDVK